MKTFLSIGGGHQKFSVPRSKMQSKQADYITGVVRGLVPVCGFYETWLRSRGETNQLALKEMNVDACTCEYMCLASSEKN